MNRRQLLNSATCLIPGAAYLQGSTKAVASFPAGDSGVSCFGEDDAILASRNTEEVVMELLHICLERIKWQGAVSDWQSLLDQALDRVQSQLDSKTNTRPLLFTAFQMDCLTDLCSAAVTGDEAEILVRARLLCHAIPPCHHWCENGLLPKEDQLELTRSIPFQNPCATVLSRIADTSPSHAQFLRERMS